MDRRAVLRAGLLLGLTTACSGGQLTRQDPTPSPGAPSDRPAPPGPTTTASPTDASTPAPPAPVQPQLLCRDAWGAAPSGADDRAHTITGLMVHHAAVALDDNRDAPSRMRGYQRYHQEQGWPDVAYHVGVDRNGHLYELRNPSLPGDTFTDYDPSGWLLVLADGNFDVQEPTPAQVEGVARVLAWGAEHFGTDTRVHAHRDHAQTSCPGDHLYARVADGSLEARVVELLAAGGVALEPVCGQEADALVAAIEAGEA